MSLFKVGNVWKYDFQFGGKRYAGSTRLKNERLAQKYVDGLRANLALGKVGLAEKRPAPTLRQFQTQFDQLVNSNHDDHPRTREFYLTTYEKLVDFEPWADLRLDAIDEAMIEKFKFHSLKLDLEKPTINRRLATLKKALRYAQRKLRLIERLPVIELYPNERRRDFLYDDTLYKGWIEAAPVELACASVLARRCGICKGEMLALQKDCVALWDKPNEYGSYGVLTIKRGLKRDARRRELSISADMAEVLRGLLERSKCRYVFTSPDDPKHALPKDTLSDQVRRTKTKLNLHRDAGLHALRHTFLTEAGRMMDVKTLQYVAGHESVVTTMRYVHVQRSAVNEAFAKLNSQIGQAPLPLQKVPTISTMVETKRKTAAISA